VEIPFPEEITEGSFYLRDSPVFLMYRFAPSVPSNDGLFPAASIILLSSPSATADCFHYNKDGFIKRNHLSQQNLRRNSNTNISIFILLEI